MILVTLSWISILTACSTNVIPQNGPTMEEVYDGMNAEESTVDDEYSIVKEVPSHATFHQFRKLSNPELTMYVFPHLAGKDDVPIPGYYTTFNVYTHTHYAVSSEVIRE